MSEDKATSLLDEISKLLALLLKRSAGSSTTMKELYAAGFQPKRIAELIGTTPNTVRVLIHQAKKSKKTK